MTIGKIIYGSIDELLVRQKSDKKIELGELFVVDNKNSYTILQAYDLKYSSQIGEKNRELISGMDLEGQAKGLEFLDPNLSNYIIASLKTLITIKDGKPKKPKKLPPFFSDIREIKKKDLTFLSKPTQALYMGKLRSGTRNLNLDIFLDGENVLKHHILIPASTGSGKSNLVKVLAWSILNKQYCGLLILDPHDEYYGRNRKGLKDHPSDSVIYYTTKNPPPGSRTLMINIKDIKPFHFKGIWKLSDAQKDAVQAVYNKYKEDWIYNILAKNIPQEVRKESADVIKRKLNILGISLKDGEISCKGVFSSKGGKSTLSDIVSGLEKGNTIIVDTSNLSQSVELLIGTMTCSRCLWKYKKHKTSGNLKDKPVINIVIEEAPRVLGKDVLASGRNIFSTIAREGRKFKIGLTAITQLPSIIPRQILANMNTKIILSLELEQERTSVIQSVPHDLSKDDKNIASLNIGEAIVTSNFSDFPIPVKIPKFEHFIEPYVDTAKQPFDGMVSK